MQKRFQEDSSRLRQETTFTAVQTTVRAQKKLAILSSTKTKFKSEFPEHMQKSEILIKIFAYYTTLKSKFFTHFTNITFLQKTNFQKFCGNGLN